MTGAKALTAQIQLQTKFIIETKQRTQKKEYERSPFNGSRRSRTEIIAVILLFCTSKRTKTSILYNTNLNYPQLQNHLSFLISFGLLKQDENRYMTSQKGNRFIELFTELQNVLREGNTPTNQIGPLTRALILPK